MIEASLRTILDIEDDVLLAAREIARQQRLSMGKVLSDLARQTLTRRTAASTRHGVPLFPTAPHGGVVTLELVNQLRDEISRKYGLAGALLVREDTL